MCGSSVHMQLDTELEASRLPPPQPTTPLMAPLPITPPPRALLPSQPLPADPVQSPALDRRLSLPPRPYLQPSPPPPCSSTLPEPMDGEAVITAPPSSPMEVIAPPPHPSLPSDGDGLGRFSKGWLPRPLTSNVGTWVDSAPRQFRCPSHQLRRRWVSPPAARTPTQRRCWMRSKSG
ncbi:uncharacterized protein LOC126336042 [Schistocerca gregaria]|uniref:uncharacterized protein LOC126336042 n=1 Tax=Schistocerca gregaria TaxID=7010 RepID=UPI00211EC99B|nr:uncharacterized protein LOC126336042 [Schistocerca gregaria]